MQKYILLILLGICSIEDIKKKELTVIYIFLFGIIGVLLHLACPSCSTASMIWGWLLGAAMMAVSIASRGSIGMGDGILLTVTGVYLGGMQNLRLFFTALFLAALWSMAVLLLKKKKRKERIAFVPFLLAAYGVLLIGP